MKTSTRPGSNRARSRSADRSGSTGSTRPAASAGSARSSATPEPAPGLLATVRPAHFGLAVLLAALVIGIVVEPGGSPSPAEAVDPIPLPSIPAGRAASTAATDLPLPPAIDRPDERRTRPARELAPVPASSPRTDIARGAIELDPLIDLGEVAFGASVERTITFRNRGQQPVSILDVRTTCGCTAAQPDVDRLAPGEQGSVRIVFTGKNPGQQAQFVRLVTDDAAQPVVSVRIRATVTGG